MGFFDRFKLKTKQAPVVVYTGVTSSSNRRSTYQEFAKEGYQQNAIVYRCVNEIANGAAAAQWLAYRNGVKLEQHPILSLLQRPNPRKAGVEYFQALYAYLLLSGNSYGLQAGPEGAPPRELYLLRPDRVTIIQDKTEIPAAYEYKINGKTEQRYPVEIDGSSVVKHFALWHPLDDFYGMSPIQAASLDIDQHNMAAQHNVGLLANGARPSGALIFKPKDDTGATIQLSEGQRNQLLSDLEMRFTGQKNAGRPLLLEGDFDWKEMGISPKDMDFLSLKNMAARDIALCFGVPGQLVGVPDSQTYANVAEARLALYEETIIPLMRRIESDINEWLSPLYGDDVQVQYDLDSIPAISERRRRIFDNVIAGVNAGIISRNEARERLGLDKVEGADELYIPANLFPLGQVSDEGLNDEPTKAHQVAYGKRITEIYPNGEPVPENLPDAYRLHSSYRKCANCAYMDDEYCELYDAPIRLDYVCNSWASHTDESAKAAIDLKPTEAMAEEAGRALKWREEGNRGGTLVGVARANQLVKRETLSERTVMRMHSYFSRHEVDKEAEGFRPGEDGYPSPGRVAWGLWGGDAGQVWARAKRDEIERGDNSDDEDYDDENHDEDKSQKAPLKVGDYVSWDSSGGTARGRITRIVTSGTLEVPGSSFILRATEENPAMLIRLYRRTDDGWRATTTVVGHRADTLTKIPDLE